MSEEKKITGLNVAVTYSEKKRVERLQEWHGNIKFTQLFWFLIRQEEERVFGEQQT